MSSQRSRRNWLVAGAVAAVVVLAVGAWLWLGRSDGDPFDGAQDAADRYAAAWQSGELDGLVFGEGVPGPDVASQVTAITAGLAPTGADAQRPSVTVTGVTPDPEDSHRGTAQVQVTWSLTRDVPWTYAVDTPLVKEGGDWRVAWSPSVVAPGLQEGEVLDAERVPAERGTILDASGAPIFAERPVVHVGIATPKEGATEPTPEQLADTADQLAAALAPEGIDGAALRTRVADAGPDHFVEAVTLRRERYDEVRAAIHDLPGTAFQEDTMVLAPTAGFARAVLGSVGEATAEDIEQSGGDIVAGQLVGHGGLQEAYQARLAGTDGVRVQAVPDPSAAAADAPAATGAAPRELHVVAPVRGQDIEVTLDSSVQARAEAALATAPKPAAMVVVRPSTGELVAVANGGAGGDGFDRALEGRYPPGSTFKVVSTWALLGQGLSPGEPVACPPSAVVGGRTFVNAESEALGTVPFRSDFAHSCNTAFVGLADRVTDAELATAAAALGLADGYDLGVADFGGDVPANDDAVGHAAAMIGQSKVLASPLGMALVAASVADGSTVTPLLVVDPTTKAPLAPDTADTGAADGTTTTAAAPTAPFGSSTAPLDPELVGQLQQLMREVVTSGTATVLAPVPGGPVHAKTGTAEFGTDDPPRTHAWMIGYQGDLAFAVLVEDGGFGADAAGPIAARFLSTP